MSIDPYSSPASHVQVSSYSAQGAVSQGVVDQLARTKPWVRFVSVMMFIGAAVLLLLAVVMLVMGSAVASAAKNPMLSGGFGGMVAAIYGVMAFLYIYPALKLWKYATCIGLLKSSGASLDLEAALNQQRSFWKFVGVMMLIVLILYVLIFVGAIFVSMFAAMKAH